jgi:hypothetical protein
MYETRYEELRREWPDCIPSPWEKLTATQQTFWIRMFERLDNEERAKKQAYETLGKVMVLNPGLIPVEG